MIGFAPRKSRPTPKPRARPLDAPPPKSSTRWLTRRVLRLTFVVGLPIVLLPILLPRKVLARRLTGESASSRTSDAALLPPREKTIQDLVDDLRTRLMIPNPVLVAIVPENKLVVSVERIKDGDGAFAIRIEAGFLDGLSDEEVRAVAAHELGHVWISTHHPFLQTEELANEIALRLVSRDILERVYKKVWTRTGTRGTLVYLPVE